MADIILQAEARKSGRQANRELRSANKVPAVIYGPDFETQSVAIDNRTLHKALVTAGTGLISLQVGSGTPLQVLTREVQHHPVKHHMLHVDFLAVAMNEVLRLEVPVVFEGTAPAMARSGTVMMRNIDTVEVECLPRDIPQHLVANLAKLITDADSIYVRDLIVPPGVKILTELDHAVASLTMSRTEAEAAATEPTATAVSEVEVVTKGKPKEEGEAA